MKLLLALLFLSCGVLCGSFALGTYRSRVRALLDCDLFLQRLSALLSLENLPTNALFSRLSAMPELSRLSFIGETAEALADSCDFPTVYRNALQKGSASLNNSDRAVLYRLETLIGAYDLDTQLSGIESVRSLLAVQLEDARERAKRDGHLMRSLCMLGSAAAAILTL